MNRYIFKLSKNSIQLSLTNMYDVHWKKWTSLSLEEEETNLCPLVDDKTRLEKLCEGL